MLIRAARGAYGQDLIGALFQRGPGREPDFGGFFLGHSIDAINRQQLVVGSFDVPSPPRRGDIAENQRRLETVTMMADEKLFDVTTGVPAHFTALYHGGYGGGSFCEGTLDWSSTITMSTQDAATGELVTHAVPPGQCVLLPGTASIYDMRYLAKNTGAVARWPRGMPRIARIVKVDPGL